MQNIMTNKTLIDSELRSAKTIVWLKSLMKYVIPHHIIDRIQDLATFVAKRTDLKTQKRLTELESANRALKAEIGEYEMAIA